MKQLAIAILATAVLGACTNKQLYETIQSNERLECQKEVRTTEYEKCMEEVSQSYEVYQQEREKILEGEE